MTSSIAFLMLVLGAALPESVLASVMPMVDSTSTFLAVRSSEAMAAVPFAGALTRVLPFFGLIKLVLGVVVLAAIVIAVIAVVGAVMYFLSPRCSVAGTSGACRAH